MEREGGTVKGVKGDEITIDFNGRTVRFCLRWKLKQFKRPLTQSEMKWRFDDRDWRLTLVSTGELWLRINEYADGIRYVWEARKGKTFADLLPDIIAELIKASAILEAKAVQEAKSTAIAAERARAIAEKRAAIETDTERWEAFSTMAQQWKLTRIAKDFLDEMRAQPIDIEARAGDLSVEEWLVWAERKVNASDPLRNGVAPVFQEISTIKMKPGRAFHEEW